MTDEVGWRRRGTSSVRWLQRRTHMRVFVAGATGAIGRPLVKQLLARGHTVIAATRSAARADRLRALGAEGVVLDALDAKQVADAVARARPDAIIDELTALGGGIDFKRFDETFANTNALRTKGTDHLLAAAIASSVPRFVAQSYTNWTNAPTGRSPKSEEEPFDPNPPNSQRRSMAAIQYLERVVLDAPLTGIVLRYGNFYGPGPSDAMVALIAHRRLPIAGDGAGVWSWIHVDDAAAATVAAVEHGERGIYNIVDDDPAPVSVWLPYLAERVGAKRPWRLPAWLAKLFVGDAGVAMMTRVRGSSNAKAKRELGWQPTWSSWRQGFETIVPSPREGRLTTVEREPQPGSI